MIVLDTDCISLLERDNPDAAQLRKRLAEEVSPLEAATTIITFEEQMRGWLAYVNKARTLEQQTSAYEKLFRFLHNYRSIPILPFDEVAAAEFRRLHSLKVRVGTMDLKIAAIALAHNVLLVTRNLSDFEQIPNLKCEDWTR